MWKRTPETSKMGSRNGESEPCSQSDTGRDCQAETGSARSDASRRTGLGEGKNKTAGQNIEELQTQKSAADRKLQDIQQAIKVVTHLNAATAEKQKNEERIQFLGERNTKIDEALGKLSIEALTQETLTLRNAYTLMVSEKWEIHRANLTDGKPCPLCGSTTHPYHTDNRQFEEATTELSQLLKAKRIC